MVIDLIGWTKRTLVLLALATFVASASAQSLSDYFKLRSKYGIKAAAGEAALNSFVGSRIVEIKCTVKGSFSVNGKQALYVERPGGGADVIDASNAPDWLEGNSVPARLIVTASRESETSELKAKLIAAAPEATVEQVDEEVRQAAEIAAKTRRSHGSRYVASQTRVYAPSEILGQYAAFVHKQNPRLGNAQSWNIAGDILRYSNEFGVDPRLIVAMVMCESGFDPRSTSHTGAMGLGQLMPGTAKWMGVTNAYDTSQNLFGTIKLVHTHLTEYQRKTGDRDWSQMLMLAAYNAGEGAVSRAGGIPPYRETQNYVRKVSRLYNALRGAR